MQMASIRKVSVQVILDNYFGTDSDPKEINLQCTENSFSKGAFGLKDLILGRDLGEEIGESK